MSLRSQQQNMKTIHSLVSMDLGYIHGERESGPNGAKKLFHTKSAAFLRALGKDLGFNEFKVATEHGGIAVSGEITLIGLWGDGSGLFFQISQGVWNGSKSFLYRSVSGMKDYNSGRNQWIPECVFRDGNYERLVDMLLELKAGMEVMVGDAA